MWLQAEPGSGKPEIPAQGRRRPARPQNFYEEKIAGKTKSWIDANIMNRSSVVTDGNPVYPQFRRDVHVSDRPLEPIPERSRSASGSTLSGKNPAALIRSKNLRGDWFIQPANLSAWTPCRPTTSRRR